MDEVKNHPTPEASENGLPIPTGNSEEHEARRLQRLLDQHQVKDPNMRLRNNFTDYLGHMGWT